MAPSCRPTKTEGDWIAMPSLFRFLFIVGTAGAIVTGALYILATEFEPEPRTVTKPVPGVKVRTE
jgi:hypothetical protein